ncbi:AMP-binding protein [Yoonia sp. GPGPB17]|uniref:hypothetical protein n=1 Tax=Yoonia sp. GPGPB17 TaxID=3026147 RepID=UPI0030C4EA0E
MRLACPLSPEVRIAHEVEPTLTDGGVGEVVISGPNVTPGYENNPDANAKNFFDADGKRWFRTGDQGTFDADGYLTLTGRLKEIINRGGEKVSPLEVDGVLSAHPAIGQVVTFALPHLNWAKKWPPPLSCAMAKTSANAMCATLHPNAWLTSRCRAK